jgi:ABC-type multidrug transport system ATPase subunit/ABC-type multidrug transport system permease subunit
MESIEVISKNFSVSWKNIFYEIDDISKKKGEVNKRKRILNDISGYGHSKEITAIMGPSGSGKTSLLNFLTNRINFKRGDQYGGQVFINSEQKSFKFMEEVSSYVMQDDLLFDILTPKETFLFVSKLRKKMSKEEHENEVENLLQELKLTGCKNVRIGNEMKKGISGGERKRTSIGIEIMSNPSVLFLDEPTSGLDSQTSFVVIEFIKELAKNKNMAVILTIHQPSSNIMNVIDKILLVNKGELAYQGPTNLVSDYFEGIQLPLGDMANPADSFMHILEEQNARFERKEKLNDDEVPVVERYKEKIKENIDNDIKNILSKGEPCELKPKKLQSVGFCDQFSVLCHRTFINLIRNPTTFKIRIFMILLFSFIACSIFYRLDNDVQGIYNRTGFFFFFTVNNFMSILFQAILAFPLERGIFLREHANKLYGVTPYYLAKNLVETPIGLLGTFLFSVIVYYIVGLRPEAEYFFIFILNFLILSWLSQSMGLCFGASFSSLSTALIISQFSVMPAFLFSGFLINQANMPVWLAWIRFLSPFRYSLEASIRNEFDGNPNLPQNLSPVNTLNLDIGMWNCIAIMFCFGILLRILGGIFLSLLVRKTG